MTAAVAERAEHGSPEKRTVAIAIAIAIGSAVDAEIAALSDRSLSTR